jgi:hypothetical protein
MHRGRDVRGREAYRLSAAQQEWRERMREWVALMTWETEGIFYEAGGVYPSRPICHWTDTARELQPGEGVAVCPRCGQRFAAVDDEAETAEACRNLHFDGDEDIPSICAERPLRPVRLGGGAVDDAPGSLPALRRDTAASRPVGQRSTFSAAAIQPSVEDPARRDRISTPALVAKVDVGQVRASQVRSEQVKRAEIGRPSAR